MILVVVSAAEDTAMSVGIKEAHKLEGAGENFFLTTKFTFIY